MRFGSQKMYCSIAAVWLSAQVASAARLESEALVLRWNGQAQVLEIQDKRTGAEWRQTAVSPEARQSLAGVDTAGNRLKIACDLPGVLRSGQPAACPFLLQISLVGDCIHVSFSPRSSGEWRSVRYPFVWTGDSSAPLNLFPHGCGMLVPAPTGDPLRIDLPSGWLYGGTHSYLSCYGQLQTATGAGILSIVDTIEAADVFWPSVEVKGTALTLPQIGWRDNRYQFDRPLEMQWVVIEAGGYVRMAERYRGWAGTQGRVKTLRQKADELPAVDRMVGASVFWSFGTVPQMKSILDAMIEDGVRHVAQGVDQRLYDALLEPSAEEERERRGLVDAIQRAGYPAFYYDNYRDVFKKDPKESLFFQLNWAAYPQDCVVKEDGNLLNPGFRETGGVLSPSRFLLHARKKIPSSQRRYGFNARFIDNIGSCGFTEGVDWHPDRPTTIYDTRKAREELMAYAKSQRLVLGTECGQDYVVPWVDWFDGAMSLVCFDKPLDPKDLPRAGGAPYAASESVRYRIPFYQLVYHDCVSTTWRWETGMDQPIEHWSRKALWNILYGTVPLYRMEANRYTLIREKLAYTDRTVNRRARETGFERMLLHRFLTEDRTVQETLFSSGKGVVVNFGNEPFLIDGGPLVPAEGWVEFSGQERRQYDEPQAFRLP